MTLDLCYMSSDKRVVSKDIFTKQTFSDVIFKDNTDVMNPVLRLNISDDSLISTVNYVYIHELNTYYYITDVTTKARNIYEFKLHEDVLMTYRNEIRNLTAVISRQENAYNRYLDDDQYHIYNYERVQTFLFPNGLTNQSDASYVLAIAGGGN